MTGGIHKHAQHMHRHGRGNKSHTPLPPIASGWRASKQVQRVPFQGDMHVGPTTLSRMHTLGGTKGQDQAATLICLFSPSVQMR